MPTPCFRKTVPPLNRIKHILVAASSVWALSSSPVAQADDLADVTKLLRAGQPADAMARIDAVLDKHPRDMQMRFVKGVVLTEQGKTTEAITVFTKLTEDHPDLPEPYNNLAVLFAASGQYDKARAALDMAIRTNPSYATAYENLGDVHAKLASQAYDKALQLDSGNANAKSKLTLLRTLSVNSIKDTAGRTPGGAAAAAKSVPAPVVVARVDPPKTDVRPAAKVESKPEPKPVAVAKVEPKPEPKPVAVTKVEPKPEPKPVVVAKVEPKPEPKPVVVAKVEPKPEPKAVVNADPKPDVKPEAKPVVKPAVTGADNGEVLAVVHDWAAAWGAQDVKRYLGHYGNEFETPKGVSRKAWADERTARIAGKGRISVKVEAPQVTVNGNVATVKFRQVYVSDRLHADSRKTLVMAKQGGKWQIKQERTGG